MSPSLICLKPSFGFRSFFVVRANGPSLSLGLGGRALSFIFSQGFTYIVRVP